MYSCEGMSTCMSARSAGITSCVTTRDVVHANLDAGPVAPQPGEEAVNQYARWHDLNFSFCQERRSKRYLMMRACVCVCGRVRVCARERHIFQNILCVCVWMYECVCVTFTIPPWCPCPAAANRRRTRHRRRSRQQTASGRGPQGGCAQRTLSVNRLACLCLF